VPRLVQKQHFEDVDEGLGFAYRYWDLVVDVGDTAFDVRIYRDEPDMAYVAVSPRPVDDTQHAALRALARHLEEHEGAKLHVIGDGGGYEELEAAIDRKVVRENRAR
jgi:glycosyltransferase involved in cell wall biosynthesis